MVKYYLLVLIFFFSADCFALVVSGTVTDRTGAPVAGANVRFVDPNYLSKEYTSVTDQLGYYQIDSPTPAEISYAGTTSLYCYPNPFNRQTVVSFYLSQQQHVELAVFNMTGQKIRVIANSDFTQGHHQLVWDGLLHNRQPALPGLYVCCLQTNSRREAFKMMVLGGENTVIPISSTGEEPSTSKSMTAEGVIYTAYVSGKDFATHRVDGVDLDNSSTKDFVIDRAVWTPFSTTGNYLGVYNGKDYTPLFIKGVNMGTSVPGSWPGQIAISSEQYRRWFQMIADAGFNTIRIYTLHYPRFYEEFARYNKGNPYKPLYLLQGAWLDEEYPDDTNPDLHTMTNSFDQEIRDVVDCLHGNKTLGHRFGAAYGEFTVDVSQWLLGMIIGREVHAYEIETTDGVKPTINTYSGAHVSIKGASPSEVWVTERIDRLIAYERTKYHTNRPVAFSSWATLDPLNHPSEPENNFEDAASLDLNQLELTNAPGGFFVSYHAYPYYPNFINKDEKYQDTYDEMGLNSYLAYLHELKDHYTNHPLLIAEFGLPTSWGNARYSRSGMHHGGMTEIEQGEYTIRMFHNIHDSHCSGGVMFSWMDEWFKSTWITHPLTSDRRNLWHNISSPENNYGLIHFVPNPAYYNTRSTKDFSLSKVSKTEVWHDFAFFNIESSLKTPISKGDTLWFAIDTYLRDKGESTLPNGRKVLKNRAEFLVRVTSDSARLFVTKAYCIQGVIHMNCKSPAFQTKATDGEPWIPYRWQNDETWLSPNIQDIGKLSMLKGDGTLIGHYAVRIQNDKIFVRIPWTLLQFTDPSSAMVIDDNTSPSYCYNHWACDMHYLKSKVSDGVAVTVVYKNEVAESVPYTWHDWDVNSMEILNPNMYVEAEKASLPIIREGLKNNPFTPI